MKNQPRLFSFFKANTGHTMKPLPPLPDIRKQCAWWPEQKKGGFVK